MIVVTIAGFSAIIKAAKSNTNTIVTKIISIRIGFVISRLNELLQSVLLLCIFIFILIPPFFQKLKLTPL